MKESLHNVKSFYSYSYFIVFAATLDVEEFDKYPNVKEKVEAIVKDDGLNLLINNAAFTPKSALEQVTPEEMARVYSVNTIAPVMMTQVD